MRLAPFLVLLAVAAAGPASAHPGGEDHLHGRPSSLRVWKDANGIVEFEAAFVAIRNDLVVLSRVDDSPTWIPLDRLSDLDRDWVARRVEQIKALNETPVLAGEARSVIADTPNEPRNGKGLAVLAVLAAIGGVGSLMRRQQCKMSTLLVLFGSCCLLMACTGRPEQVDEIVATEEGAPPTIVAHFAAFKDKLRFRWNDTTLFIDSSGLPDHPMMIGITNWQQQVPLPQPYTGNNAFQIPLKPRMAETPISARKALFRGAIALAVNGVPIFNALNNRGADSFAIGELDEYGGHCGKADDYHYHAAPLHLQKLVGEGNPIGYALDGFPLHGLTDQKLDEFNGRFDEQGNYRYHSTKTYPYINGGLKGVVQVKGDGVEPQPRAAPIRPAQRPLRGAKITGFTVDEARKRFSLEYEVNGGKRKIDYTVNTNGSYTFAFVDESGRPQTESYTRRGGPDGKGPDKKGEKKKKGKGAGDD